MRIISQALPAALALTFAFGTIAIAQTPEQMAMVEKALDADAGKTHSRCCSYPKAPQRRLCIRQAPVLAAISSRCGTA